MNTPICESFSIHFIGPAFKTASISTIAVGQSLLALDILLRKAAGAAYGPNAWPEIEMRQGLEPASFTAELRLGSNAAALPSSSSSATAILADVISLEKWALGKPVKSLDARKDSETHSVSVENAIGDRRAVDSRALSLYDSERVQIELSRLTHTLDTADAESIAIISSGGDFRMSDTITKEDRRHFRHEAGPVLTDNETPEVLEVVDAMPDGSPTGWIFSEGEGGPRFRTAVADEKFLSDVRNGKIPLASGTSVLATVRMVQRKTDRLITERTVVEVLEVAPAA